MPHRQFWRCQGNYSWFNASVNLSDRYNHPWNNSIKSCLPCSAISWNYIIIEMFFRHILFRLFRGLKLVVKLKGGELNYDRARREELTGPKIFWNNNDAFWAVAYCKLCEYLFDLHCNEKRIFNIFIPVLKSCNLVQVSKLDWGVAEKALPWGNYGDNCIFYPTALMFITLHK